MESKFLLEMLTPERKVFCDFVDSLTVTTPTGKMGILANHEPLVAGLIPATIHIKFKNTDKTLACGEGFLYVGKEKTTVLCQTMEWPEEIELARVERSLSEHKKILDETTDPAEQKISEATIERALARLKVLQDMSANKQ